MSSLIVVCLAGILLSLTEAAIAASAQSDIQQQQSVAQPATDATASARPQSLPQVTINGAKDVSEQVHAFVSEVTRQVSSENSLARWHESICPSIVGFPPEHRDLILARLAAIAAPLALTVDSGRCQVNFFVIATTKAEEVLRGFRKQSPRIFGNALPASQERFITTDRPVRVWYNTEFVGKHGNTLQLLWHGGHVFTRNPDADGSPLEFDDLSVISSVIEIVDLNRVQRANMEQLADYVIMSGLIQTNFESRLERSPTVLGLFDTADGDRGNFVPDGLTTWDQALLHGLYVTNQSSKIQRFLIEDVMLSDLENR